MPITSERLRSTGSSTATRFRADWVRKRAKDVGFARLEDLATKAGISRQALHLYLSNAGLPSTPTSRRLAAALRCMVEDLCEDTPDTVDLVKGGTRHE